MLTNLLWSLATPIQTGILGHLSSDAIAANSVSTTMFQYLKVVTVSEASATSVSVGKMVGEGRNSKAELQPYVRALQLIFLLLGLVLGGILLAIRQPLLHLYVLSPTAKALANQLLLLMVLIFVGMAYQMPASVGIIRGGGETKFNMHLNLISTWAIVMPLSFAAAILVEASCFLGGILSQQRSAVQMHPHFVLYQQLSLDPCSYTGILVDRYAYRFSPSRRKRLGLNCKFTAARLTFPMCQLIISSNLNISFLIIREVTI